MHHTHRSKIALMIFSQLLLLSACDSFSKKDPLPGKRESYIDFGGFDIRPDTNLKMRGAPLVQPRDIDAFPGALVNFDQNRAPFKASIKENSTWAVSIGSGSDNEHRILGHPLSDGNLIYVSDAHGLISAVKDFHKEEKGEIVWTFNSIPEDAKDNASCATLTLHDGTLFVATALGEVIALDTTAHKDKEPTVKWRTHTGAPIRVMPAYKDGRVFVSGIDGKTYALDAIKGDILWAHQGFTELSSIQGGASPVVKDELVVASYSSGEVFVLRTDSDTPLWSDTITTALRSDSISSIPHIVGNPIIEGNILYVISHGGRMAAFDLSTGLTVWQQDVGSIRSPLLIGECLYIIDNTNRVVCLDKHSGKVYWVTSLPLSADNKPLLWTSPIAVNEQLVFGSSSGDLVFLNLADGSKFKTVTVKDAIVAQPIVVHGHIYLQLESGQLVKY